MPKASDIVVHITGWLIFLSLPLLFITGMPGNSNVSALLSSRYLLKPIDRARFARTVQKAIDYFNYKTNRPGAQEESIFVHSECKLVKMSLQDVEYIESLEDYIRIHLLSAKPILTLMPLKKILEKLPGDKFRRIHRSYIVAVDKVVAIANRKVKLVTSRELPVSDTYREFINNWRKS